MRTVATRIALAAAVATFVLAVGGGAIVLEGDGDEPVVEDPENETEIEREVRTRAETLESYRVTVVRTYEADNRTRTRRTLVQYEEGRVNATVLDAPDPAREGRVFVANESVSWTHNATSGEVSRFRHREGFPANFLGHLTRELFENRNVTYEGTESVGGERTVLVSYREYGETVSLSIGGGDEAARPTGRAP